MREEGEEERKGRNRKEIGRKEVDFSGRNTRQRNLGLKRGKKKQQKTKPGNC